MRQNFNQSLEWVLEHEGGYVNHPKDPGGATNKGVTQANYNRYRRMKNRTPRSVKHITSAEVKEFYKLLYWDNVQGDLLPSGIDYATFDFGVNSGPRRGVRHLQLAINKFHSPSIKVDGVVGPETIDAARAVDADLLVRHYIDKRLGFFRGLRKLWPTFGRGWTNRLLGYYDPRTKKRQDNGVLQRALSLIDETPSVRPPLPDQKPSKKPTWLQIIIAIIIGIIAVVFGIAQ